MKYPPHILVIRLSALGDVAMTVPVIKALALQYPEVHITMLSQPFVSPLFRQMPDNVHFMAADIRGEHKGVSGLNALFRRLHAKHFTHVADLHDVLRTKYLRARFIINKYHTQHINKHRKQKRQLVNPSTRQLVNSSTRSLPTTFENYTDVFKRLGYPITLQPQPVNSSTRQLVNLSTLKNLIGIAPFAAHKGKIYPLEKMENVISKLAKNDDVEHIYFFCGKGEETQIVDDWCTKYPKCSNASKQLNSLEKELQLMQQLSVMLSMDSANAHLAALAGTPVVSIWGATHPMAGFKAWQQKDDDIIQVELPCRPCSIYGNKPCGRNDYACLYNIQEDTIVQQILKHLKTQEL